MAFSISDAEVLKSLLSNGTAVVHATQAYFHWHTVAARLREQGAPIEKGLARTFNIFSKSLLEEAIMSLGRLYDLDAKSVSIIDLENKTGLTVSAALTTRRETLEQAYRGGERGQQRFKAKLFRDTIVAHVDGGQTPEDYATQANFSADDLRDLVEKTVSWLNELARDNSTGGICDQIDLEHGPAKIQDEITAMLTAWARSTQQSRS